MTDLSVTGTAMPLPSLGDTKDAAAARSAERLRTASEGFEALFVNQILKSARSTSLGPSLLDSSATETAQSMLDSKMAEVSAGRAGLGLADAIYRQFSAHLGASGE
ncbi:MAG: rod-binding protein [Phaeobacter gallaeciensis]|jgi:flagellar protein FlgJ